MERETLPDTTPERSGTTGGSGTAGSEQPAFDWAAENKKPAVRARCDSCGKVKVIAPARLTYGQRWCWGCYDEVAD